MSTRPILRKALVPGTALIVVAGLAWLAVDRLTGREGAQTVAISGVGELESFFGKLDYTLEGIRKDHRKVPKAVLDRLPPDWRHMSASRQRKRLFFRSVIPLALIANRAIESDRQRLERLADARSPSDKDEAWLRKLARTYEVKLGASGRQAAIRELLLRVDIIPLSLTLAQAADESGWGTSAFAHEGNALFGQWGWGKGMTPAGGQIDGDNKVAAFESLQASVEAYMLNLNTEAAYDGFRKMRARERAAGAFDGKSLAATLTMYSSRGPAYTSTIQSIIDENELAAYHDAQLDIDGTRYDLTSQ